MQEAGKWNIYEQRGKGKVDCNSEPEEDRARRFGK